MARIMLVTATIWTSNQEVQCEKGLGVIFYQDLKSSVHRKEAYSKANRIMLGLMSRTSKYRNPKSMINIYKSLVRPYLDHC